MPERGDVRFKIKGECPHCGGLLAEIGTVRLSVIGDKVDPPSVTMLEIQEDGTPIDKPKFFGQGRRRDVQRTRDGGNDSDGSPIGT